MKKILIFVIGILLIIFAFLTFNLFKDNLNSLETTSEMLNINSELVQELYSTINPSEDANVLIGLYENDKISNEYILACGITNYLKEYNIAPEYISKIDVENSIHSIFGYSTPIVHEDVYILNDKACGYFYNSKIEKYQLVSGCGGNNNEKFYRKIISAEKKNNFIFIKEKSIYMYNDWNEYINKVFIYNNYNKLISLDYFEKSAEEDIEIDLNDYLEQASTYIYKFRLKNGNYIFDSISLDV